MLHPADPSRCNAMSNDHAGRARRTISFAVSSLRRATLLRRAALALLFLAALLVGSVPPAAQPIALKATPAAASVEAVTDRQVSGSLVLGAYTGVTAARKAMLPNGTFISGWGAPRSDGRTHQGEDIAAPRGSPIYAPARLYIYSNGWNTYGGWTVSGRDAKGRHWYFAHLNSRSPVPYGRTVYKGQILGYVGTSGNAAGTTPHLHYQVSWPGGGWGNPVYVLQYYPDVP